MEAGKDTPRLKLPLLLLALIAAGGEELQRLLRLLQGGLRWQGSVEGKHFVHRCAARYRHRDTC